MIRVVNPERRVGGYGLPRPLGRAPSRVSPVLLAICSLLVSPGVWLVTGSGEPEGVKGVSYEHYRIREVPLSINVIRIDRSQTNLELTTTLGHDSMFGLSPLSDQVRGVPSRLGQPVAAINGDFYRLEHEPYAGDPRGLQIIRGELVSAPIDRAAFWLDALGQPHIGQVYPDFNVIWPDGTKTPFGLNEEREGSAVLYTSAVGFTTGAYGGTEFVLEQTPDSPWLPLSAGQRYKARIREIRPAGQTRLKPGIAVLSIENDFRGRPKAKVGDIVDISTTTQPDLKGTQTAIGGGPSLVHEGKARPGYVPKSMERHPRSALGWNKKEFLFVEVDGRQRGFSIGMTLPELAAYLVKLGCEEAMGLDGGGSAELWLRGRIMNSPCYGRERSTANALVLVDKSERKTSE